MGTRVFPPKKPHPEVTSGCHSLHPKSPFSGLDGEGGPWEPPHAQQLPGPRPSRIHHNGTSHGLVLPAVPHVDLCGGDTANWGGGSHNPPWGPAPAGGTCTHVDVFDARGVTVQRRGDKTCRIVTIIMFIVFNFFEGRGHLIVCCAPPPQISHLAPPRCS